jgi:hypothetical protein
MNTYKIKPHPYAPPPPFVPPDIPRVTESERSAAARIAGGGHYGCGTITIVGLLFILGVYTVGWIATSVATFTLPLAYYFIRRANETNRLANNRIQAERERIRSQQASHESTVISQQAAIETEAVTLASTLTTIHNSAPSQLQSLKRSLSTAEADLDAADRDFTDSAFAPFWDSIERAANNLSSFNQTTYLLTAQASQYYNSLRDRDHTFPNFPVTPTALPDPTHTTDRMQSIVRKAQCNFQFATIYEQRKTNNILKHGFMSLSSAISELGYTVRYSMDQLRESVSSDIALLVDEQIATRESIDSAAASAEAASQRMLEEERSGNEAAAKRAEQQHEHEEQTEAMLDNIQRRRKPVTPKIGDGTY